MAGPRVTVLGSLNTDISVPVPHLPGPGETVLAAAAASIGTGGKGANQAVAAARLGAATRMVGCCGDDEFGGRLRDVLAAEGIDVAGLRTVPGAASGLALITVDPAGENVIAVAPGANGLADEVEVAAAFSAPCDVLVLSAEIPVSVLAAALRRANAVARGGEEMGWKGGGGVVAGGGEEREWKGGGGVVAGGGKEREWKGGGGAVARGGERSVRTVLNLAPIPEGADRLLAARPDWLVVNAHEAGVLLGAEAADVAQAQAMAARLAAGEAGPGTATGSPAGPDAGRGDRHVVITLGAAGAVLAGPAVAAAIGGFSVPAVDTVGAGDAFVGALAVALAAGLDPTEAVRAACAAGATATTLRGAQDGLPRPADVLAATGFRWPEIAD
jgi:ribokinase